jgi:O-antigen biosynthesis protein WbqP
VSKRVFDFIASFLLMALLSPLFFLCALIVRLGSPGPVLYFSKRVGRGNVFFMMPKFRTMRVDTPQVATHLLVDSSAYLTPAGAFLRRTSLDELPQLWSVWRGEMSLVGPRPALFNQDDLVAMRTLAGVHTLSPGITGWAQINGRDELPLERKVELDEFYLKHRSFFFDLKILFITVLKVFKTEGVSH